MISCLRIEGNHVYFHCDLLNVNFDGKLEIDQVSEGACSESHRISVAIPEGVRATEQELAEAYTSKLASQINVCVVVSNSSTQVRTILCDAVKALNVFTAGRDCQDC